MWLLYNALLMVLILLGWPALVLYSIFSSKRRRIVLKRLAVFYPRRRTGPPAIWIHALSVGETIAASPLVAELNKRHPRIPISFSISTRTGFEVGRSMYADKVDRLFYYPYDLPWSVKAAIRRINPRMVMIVETDVWPNLLFYLSKQRIPAVFVNAKLSDRSYAGCRRFGRFFKTLYNQFARIVVQTDQDRRRFESLGVEPNRIVVAGNIKFDQPPVAMSDADKIRLRRQLKIEKTRPILIAGSTHPGEEVLIRDSFAAVKHAFPELCLIVAPRDPQRAESVAKLLSQNGMVFQPLATVETSALDPHTDGIVVDRLGLLRQLYAVADIALVGGSLLKIEGIGGHNPLEPAVFAKPILFGPHAVNFREMYHLLVSAGGARQVADAAELSDAVITLLKQPELLGTMGRRAYDFYRANQGAVAKTLDCAASYIENHRAASL